MGVDFDKIYYESQTYLEGKGKVMEGLEKGIFYRREDGSVWADLTKDGLDEKLLLRADGTSVYMTQDIGTAKLRFDDYPINKMIYVVAVSYTHLDVHFMYGRAVIIRIVFHHPGIRQRIFGEHSDAETLEFRGALIKYRTIRIHAQRIIDLRGSKALL